MTQNKQIVIFGEVLFDCFESGDMILGGAPFNVAWHLNAFGDQPKFVSRVGCDEQADMITAAMTTWQMDKTFIQSDSVHPTGRVDVTVRDNEPHYDIVNNVAYDFIADEADNLPSQGILYHGSLALRNAVSRQSFDAFISRSNFSFFVDVNLRSPWWTKADIEQWLFHARWAKLNEDELSILGFDTTDIKQAARQLHTQFNLEQAIVTRGASGALVCTQHDFHHVKPPNVTHFIDTVGAGDAFTARYIHGLLHDEPIEQTLDAAQKFAIKVIGLRGATSTDPAFYS